MIEFAADQLITLAKSKADAGDYPKALEILKRTPHSSQRADLEHAVRYAWGKILAARGAFSEAREQFAACTGNNAGIHIRSLAQERCRLLRAIFDGASTSVGRLAGAHSTAKIAPTSGLNADSMQPDIWFVASAAAYRSGYDAQWHDNLSRLIRMTKRNVQAETLSRLGQLLADFTFSHTPVLRRADFLVPVPTSPDRWNERGYKIPTALAAEISRMCAIPMHQDVLVTHGDLPDLRSIPRWHRAAAIEGAYEGSKTKWIEGRSLVIIDDIITTGSTLSEIARTLLRGGAAEVAAISLAHTEYST